MKKCCSVAWVAQLQQKQIRKFRESFISKMTVVRRDAIVATIALLLDEEEDQKKVQIALFGQDRGCSVERLTEHTKTCLSN